MSPASSALSMLQKLRDDGHSSVIVGYSGGKDSLAAMDLAHRVGFKKVHAYFYYAVPDLRCENQRIDLVERRYGVTVHRLPAPILSESLRLGINRSFSLEMFQKLGKKLQYADLEAILRQRTGADWFVYGHRTCDSPQRCGMIKPHQGRIERLRRMYPLWDWKPVDVLSYLRFRGLPIPAMFGSSIRGTSGIAPDSPDCLLWLKKFYPDDLQKLFKFYPFAKLIIPREEARARHAIHA